MSHTRQRHITKRLSNEASFWPVIGILGLRQSGKSTLFRDLYKSGAYISLDDETSIEDATLSAKNFLSKLPRPITIDEVQKVPGLFDAIKFEVDKKKRPGRFFLTGSSQFSTRIGIRESLTGRIGILYLYPMTLAEETNEQLNIKYCLPFHDQKPRFSCDTILKRMESGGLPVPLFLRDQEKIRSYFSSWTETTILRDVARAYGKGYSSDIAYALMRQMGALLREGEFPSLLRFKQNSRIVRRYFSAMEDVFILQKIAPHEKAVGNDVWLPADTGIAAHLAGGVIGDGISLSLGRIAVINEIRALCEYCNRRIPLLYFKSARGSPVDLVWNNVPIKISILPKSRLVYDERPLAGAMKKLGSKRGILAVPNDSLTLEKSGISCLPWTYWS